MLFKKCLLAILLVLIVLPHSAYSQTPDQPIILLNDGDIWTYTDNWQQHTNFGFYRELALATDGTQIAFTGITPEYAEFVSSGAVIGDSLPSTEMWVMSLPVGELQRIGSQDDHDGNVFHSAPTFAPDNATIAWTELVDSLGYYLAVYDRASGTISRNAINFPVAVGGFPTPPFIKFAANGLLGLAWFGQSEGEIGYLLAEFDLTGQPATTPVFLGETASISHFVSLSDGSWAVPNQFQRWTLADTSNGSLELMEHPPVFGTPSPPNLLSFETDHTDTGATWIVFNEDGQQNLPYHEFNASKISLSPDSNRIVFPDEQGLVIWENGTATALPFPEAFLPQAVAWSAPAWFHEVEDIPEFE